MQHASRDQALAAIRQFHAEHGRLPRWREWEQAGGHEAVREDDRAQ